MELVAGASLAYIIPRARGGLPRDAALSVMKQLASGLAHVHEHGVVHRDVSAHNVMINRTGVVKLIDFGIAKAPAGPALTAPGQVIGKVGYMPPEQLLGDEIDARADVFGAGVVFYEIATGRRPFGKAKGRSKEVMTAVMEGTFEPPHTHGVDAELSRIIQSAMATDPRGPPRRRRRAPDRARRGRHRVRRRAPRRRHHRRADLHRRGGGRGRTAAGRSSGRSRARPPRRPRPPRTTPDPPGTAAGAPPRPGFRSAATCSRSCSAPSRILAIAGAYLVGRGTAEPEPEPLVINEPSPEDAAAAAAAAAPGAR